MGWSRRMHIRQIPDSPDCGSVGVAELQICCIADSPDCRLVGVAELQIRWTADSPEFRIAGFADFVGLKILQIQIRRIAD